MDLDTVKEIINILNEIIKWDETKSLLWDDIYRRLFSFNEKVYSLREEELYKKWRFFVVNINSNFRNKQKISKENIEFIKRKAEEIKQPFEKINEILMVKNTKKLFQFFCEDLVKNLSLNDFLNSFEIVANWRQKANEMQLSLNLLDNKYLKSEKHACQIICQVLNENDLEKKKEFYPVIQACTQKLGYTIKQEEQKSKVESKKFKDALEANQYIDFVCQKLVSNKVVCSYANLKEFYNDIVEIFQQFLETNDQELKQVSYNLGLAIEKMLEVKNETEYLNNYNKLILPIKEIAKTRKNVIIEDKSEEKGKKDSVNVESNSNDNEFDKSKEMPVQSNVFINFYLLKQKLLTTLNNNPKINKDDFKDYLKQIREMKFSLRKEYANPYVEQVLADLQTIKEVLTDFISRNSVSFSVYEQSKNKIESTLHLHDVYGDVFTTYFTILSAIQNYTVSNITRKDSNSNDVNNVENAYNYINIDAIHQWLDKLQICGENFNRVPYLLVDYPPISKVSEMLQYVLNDLNCFNGIDMSKLDRLKATLNSYLNKSFYSQSSKNYSFYDFCDEFSTINVDELSKEQIITWKEKLNDILLGYENTNDPDEQRIYKDASAIQYLLDSTLQNFDYSQNLVSYNIGQIKEINLYHKTINDYYVIMEDMRDLLFDMEDDQDFSYVSDWEEKLAIIYKNLGKVNKDGVLDGMQQDSAQILRQLTLLKENDSYNLDWIKSIVSKYVTLDEIKIQNDSYDVSIDTFYDLCREIVYSQWQNEPTLFQVEEWLASFKFLQEQGLCFSKKEQIMYNVITEKLQKIVIEASSFLTSENEKLYNWDAPNTEENKRLQSYMEDLFLDSHHVDLVRLRESLFNDFFGKPKPNFKEKLKNVLSSAKTFLGNFKLPFSKELGEDEDNRSL